MYYEMNTKNPQLKKSYGSELRGHGYGDNFVWGPYRPMSVYGNFGASGRGSGGRSSAATAASAMDVGAWMLSVLEAQRAAREKAYRAAAESQRRSYEFAQRQVDDSTEDALQEAYINKMMSLKALPQQLAAQGLSGGASESVTAGLLNSYGDARNDLELERQHQMAELLNVYQQNMAKLQAQRSTGEAVDLAKLIPQLARLTADNAPSLASVQQGQTPEMAAAAAMKRLRHALGLEEEE